MTAPFAFHHTVHDRHTEVREDPEVVAGLWARGDTRVLVVGGEHVATEGGGIGWLETSDAPGGERIYLGEIDGRHHFAVVVERVADDLAPTSLRALGELLSDDAEGALAAHAVAVARWHQSHPYCARCGSATDVAPGGHLRRCPSCGAQHFPRTDPAVIMLATDDADRALLGRQSAWPTGRYSTLAGFVEPGESLEDAVRREIHEEAGVEIGAVTYAGSQPWPFPSSLMLGFFAQATSHEVSADGDELEDVRWFSRDDVTRMTASGELALPGGISISRWLIGTWHGGEITGAWR